MEWESVGACQHADPNLKANRLYDRRGDCVLFAGSYSGLNSDKIIVCRVTRKALSILTGASDIPSSELLQAYMAHAEFINNRATAKYRQGDNRPVIDAPDVMDRYRTDTNS